MCSLKNVFLKISQNSQENGCAGFSYVIKKETLVHVFSCEFCEIFESTFLTQHLLATERCSKPFKGLLKNSYSGNLRKTFEKTVTRLHTLVQLQAPWLQLYNNELLFSNISRIVRTF